MNICSFKQSHSSHTVLTSTHFWNLTAVHSPKWIPVPLLPNPNAQSPLPVDKSQSSSRFGMPAAATVLSTLPMVMMTWWTVLNFASYLPPKLEWIASLRDYASIHVDSESLHDSSSLALDSSYSSLGKEVLLPVSLHLFSRLYGRSLTYLLSSTIQKLGLSSYKQ